MSFLAEVSIYYVSCPKDNFDVFAGQKERKRLFVSKSWSFLELKRKITEDCGIKEEAVKRGLGSNIDIAFGRIDKREKTKLYNITNDQTLNVEKEQLEESPLLSGMSTEHELDINRKKYKML